MSRPVSESFDLLVQSLAGAGVRHSPSELHGVICGLLSTGLGSEDAELLGLLASHCDHEAGWTPELAGALAALRDQARAAYDSDELELVLLLPDDEEDLGVRVAALGQWAEGFLVGFGTGSAGMKDTDLPTGLQEALSDMAAISQVELPDQDDEEQEVLYEAVADHVRMAAVMIFTELALLARRRSGRDDATVPPVTH